VFESTTIIAFDQHASGVVTAILAPPASAPPLSSRSMPICRRSADSSPPGSAGRRAVTKPARAASSYNGSSPPVACPAT
jgi:hypothetical protein